MILFDVYCKRHYDDFISTNPSDLTYSTIYDWIIKTIDDNGITEDDIIQLFWTYSSDIEYIRIFNIIFPCCYILYYKRQFVAMIIMLKFMSYQKEE